MGRSGPSLATDVTSNETTMKALEQFLSRARSLTVFVHTSVYLSVPVRFFPVFAT